MKVKEFGKLLRSKSVGNWSSSYEKNLPGRGLTKVEKHSIRVYVPQNTAENHKIPLATVFPQSRFETRIPFLQENTRPLAEYLNSEY